MQLVAADRERARFRNVAAIPELDIIPALRAWQGVEIKADSGCARGEAVASDIRLSVGASCQVANQELVHSAPGRSVRSLLLCTDQHVVNKELVVDSRGAFHPVVVELGIVDQHLDVRRLTLWIPTV